MGAGGSRPLLYSFASRTAAATDREPTYRVLGASIAARAASERPVEPRPGGPSAERSTIANRDAPVPAHRNLSEAGATKGDEAPARRGRWADDEVPCDRMRDDADDDYADDDLAMEAEEEDGGGGDEDWEEEEPTPEELRQAWLRECSAVKALAAQGRHASSAALAAAREARDQAEENWRRARKPVPLSIRMGFAQRKLDKAQAALTRVRLELDEFDEETDRRRAEIRKRIDEADARYRNRVTQMDDLHAEAAGLAASSTADGAAAKRAERDGEVCTMVALELQAIAETLDEGADARGKINLLLARVATATARPPVEQFDIGDVDDSAEDGAGDAAWSADSSGRWNRVTRRGKSHAEASGSQCNNQHRGEGLGQRKPVGAGTGTNATGAAAAAGTDAGSGSKAAEGMGVTAAATTTAAPPSAPKPGIRRREEGEQDDAARGKSHRGHDDVGVQSVEVQGDDYRRALKLREEQAIAAAAAIEGQAVFGDERSRQIAGQLYEHKVSLLKARATELGLAPTSGGRQLIELTPEELAEWMRRVLEPAERAAKGGKEEDREL